MIVELNAMNGKICTLQKKRVLQCYEGCHEEFHEGRKSDRKKYCQREKHAFAMPHEDEKTLL